MRNSLSGLNLGATNAISYLGAALAYNFGTSQYYPFIGRTNSNASMRYNFADLAAVIYLK